MKQLKLLGVAIMAMFALTSALATTASAETLPNVLPTATAEKPVTANVTSGVSTFGNGLLTLTSTSGSGTQTGNSAKLGFFDELFLGVKDLLSRKCTGLSDTTEGSVLALGTFHTRDFKENGTLLTASVLLLKEIHFSCGTLLVIVKGCVAGALTPENKLTKTLTLTFAKNGEKNDNLIITVLNEENNKEEACQLLSSSDEGAFELSNQKETATVNGFKQSGAEVEVLVMRL